MSVFFSVVKVKVATVLETARARLLSLAFRVCARPLARKRLFAAAPRLAHRSLSPVLARQSCDTSSVSFSRSGACANDTLEPGEFRKRAFPRSSSCLD